MAAFTNQATLSYNSNVVASNIVSGEVLQVISAVKDAVTKEYSSGDILTYVINIRNSGTTDYTNLTITDDLGAYDVETDTYVPLTFSDTGILYYIDGIAQATPTYSAGPPLEISGISVPAGAVTTITYRAVVNSFAPLGTSASITNTAIISGGGISELITAKQTVSHTAEPKLTITKGISPQSIIENGQITYTFDIENYGRTDAVEADGVFVKDTFNPSLSSIAVSLDGTAWTTPTYYSYNEDTGEFSTVAGKITIPAATFEQDAATGLWITKPKKVTLKVVGTV